MSAKPETKKYTLEERKNLAAWSGANDAEKGKEREIIEDDLQSTYDIAYGQRLWWLNVKAV